MSSPLRDLREMLAGRVAVAGRIVSMANGAVRVATAQGVVEVVLDGGGNVGDRVSVRDGRAVRVQEAVEVPVFWV
ncbi:MAG: hypothetical protein G8237_12300 [Magnetococcales bacterium]|nr:hypothetical protein [Magnetococcales bacterium]NGZ07125.1 hypothetical protein [Magnetococcales bacterium]